MLERIKETANFIRNKFPETTDTGIILGTGLGGLIERVEIKSTISYEDIPNFPISTVEGHKGQLIFGKLGGKFVIVMQGRFHYYEGYSLKEVTFPVRVLQSLGVRRLFVSNASGGMNPEFEIGDIMMLTDHINMFGDNPLTGKNIDELGPRFPDMSCPYSPYLCNAARDIAAKHSIVLKEGVYVGLSGPSFETPAEYKMLRVLGADAVGMSTVPEIIVARHMDMECFGLSVITDIGVPGKIVEISHEDVQKAAAQAEPKMALIIEKLVESLR